MSEEYKKLKEHPTVAKLAQFAGKESVLELVGYVGPAPDDSTIRIYFTLKSNHYADIPTEGIAHIEELGNGDDGPVTVYVLGSSEVRVVSTNTATIRAAQMTTSFGQQTGPLGPGTGPIFPTPPEDPIGPCLSQFFHCLSSKVELWKRGEISNLKNALTICNVIFEDCLSTVSGKRP